MFDYVVDACGAYNGYAMCALHTLVCLIVSIMLVGR
uniref:Uncharacterized protein n=1 Tax=Siphoviridae sp. cteEQ43 TaxID=2827905 RepID=A0A8S5TCQ0_9CAUD|nr:MAG TPA: hypothetical protein [Siphoviridae sp. cteEQ43]